MYGAVLYYVNKVKGRVIAHFVCILSDQVSVLHFNGYLGETIPSNFRTVRMCVCVQISLIIDLLLYRDQPCILEVNEIVWLIAHSLKL